MKRLRRIINSISVLKNEKIVLKWAKSSHMKNFGDDLGPILFSKISGKEVVYPKDVSKLFNHPVYVLVGSILNGLRFKNAVVCGAGFIGENNKVNVKPKKVLAVRGPLTRKELMAQNIDCPEVYCDPGLLVSKYFPQSEQKLWDVGIIPHYIDKEDLASKKIEPNGMTFRIIDIQDDVDSFLREINKCRYVVSSSLHGIITAHSYGIPAVWMQLSDKVIGGEFKFQDYYLSLGETKARPLVIGETINLADIKSLAKTYDFKSNCDQLLRTLETHFSTTK